MVILGRNLLIIIFSLVVLMMLLKLYGKNKIIKGFINIVTLNFILEKIIDYRYGLKNFKEKGEAALANVINNDEDIVNAALDDSFDNIEDQNEECVNDADKE